MAITVEELEILISANVADALSGMKKVQQELQRVMQAAAPRIQQSVEAAAAPVRQAMSQAAASVAKSNAESIKLAQQAGQAGQAVYKAYEKARLGVEDTRVALGELEQKMGDIARQTMRDMAEFYPDPEKLDAAAAAALDADGAYQKLGERFDALGVKLRQYQGRMEDAKNTLTELSRQAEGAAGASGSTVPVVSRKEAAPAVSAGDNGLSRTAAAATAVRQAMEKANSAARRFGVEARKSASKATTAFVKLGGVIRRVLVAAGIYKALSALFSFIKNGIQNAIAAPEIENRFRVSLGNMAQEAEQFARQFKKALGVPELSTKNDLSTFMSMITAMGIGEKTAYAMSRSMTILAHGVASFYDVSLEQAFSNLQSALSGEMEAVRKYGYMLTEANVKQAAYRHGIAQTGAELTEAQKVAARHNLLLEQSAKAQGDLARTGGGLANQLRILSANLSEAGRSIGQAFLPFIQAVVPWLNAFAVVLQRVGVALATFTYSLFGKDYQAEMQRQKDLMMSYGGAAGAIQGVADAEKEAGDAAAKAGKDAQKSALRFDELNKLQAPQETGQAGGGGAVELPGLPELSVPEGESPFEKMADAIIEKLQKLKEAMMNLGLREVLDNFGTFFAQIGEQIERYDFGSALKNALLNGFELAMSAINMAQRIVFPVAVALDIPGIVYESVNTLAALFEAVNDAVRAVTPGMEQFVQLGLVPIAEWIGEKLHDGFKFLAEQLKKVGDWFTGHTGLFTEFGEAVGKLTAALWDVVKPLADSAWKSFKGLVSGAVDMLLKMAEVVVRSLTPAIRGIADWIKKNQKPIMAFLDLVLKALLGIAAVKGIKKVFTNIQSGIKTFVKVMDGASLKILGLSEAINDFVKKGALHGFKTAFGELKGNVAQAFKDMGYALSEFGKSVWAFVKANPWAVLVTAVVGVATAIGVTLYDNYKRTKQMMEEENLKKAFDGIPISLEAVQAAMEGVVAKYDVLTQKSGEHQSAMQSLQGEYTNVIASVDAGFAALESGSGEVSGALDGLYTNMLSLSGNLKSQIDTDGQYYYGMWARIFDDTDVLSAQREQALLESQMTALNDRKGKIDTWEKELAGLLGEYRAAEVSGEETKMADIQKKLEEHYQKLAGIAAQEQARQAEVDKQRQMLLAREILEGRQIVTQENYKELLGQIEQDEKSARDSVINNQADVLANLEANHAIRTKQLEDDLESQKKAHESLETLAGTQLEIEEEKKAYQERLTAANQDYDQSLQDIGSTAIETKFLLTQGFSETAEKAVEVQDEFEGITERIQELEQHVKAASGYYTAYKFDTTGVSNAKDEITKLKQELQNLVDANPEMFEKKWGKQFEFVAGESAAATREIQSVIDTSIQETIRYGATQGGVFSDQLADGMLLQARNRLGDIKDVSGSMADTMLDTFDEKFDINSPSKVMIEKGKYIMEGLTNGIVTYTPSAERAMQTAADKIKNCADKTFYKGKTSTFTQHGIDIVKGLASGITDGTQTAITALVTAGNGLITKFKELFQIADVSGVFVTFGSGFMLGLAKGIQDNVQKVQKELEALNEKINQDYDRYMRVFQQRFVSDLSARFSEYSTALNNMRSATSNAVGGMQSAVSSAVSSISRSIASLIDDIDDAIDKLEELERKKSGGKPRKSGGYAPEYDDYSAHSLRTTPAEMRIPELARGAVLKRPTLNIAGEYAGAVMNPEIVAPQSIMRETFVESLFPAVAALSGKLDQVIAVIKQIDPSVQIGDDVVYSSAVRGGRKFARVTGKEAFGV